MSDHDVELRFICPSCNYVAQIAGKRYFELGCNFHIETRKCKSCLRLFDNVVTKAATPEEIKAQSAEFSRVYANHKWDNPIDEMIAHGDSLKQIKGTDKKNVNCRWCGSSKNEVWHLESPICPKCEHVMNVSEVCAEERVFEYFDSFKELINSGPKILACLVDSSCGVCRHLKLMLDEIQQDNPDEFRFIEFDSAYADENNLVYKYKLRYLPTLLHFKDGIYVGKFSKVDSKPELLKKIRKRFLKKI